MTYAYIQHDHDEFLRWKASEEAARECMRALRPVSWIRLDYPWDRPADIMFLSAKEVEAMDSTLQGLK
jgi:hypothetical protein